MIRPKLFSLLPGLIGPLNMTNSSLPLSELSRQDKPIYLLPVDSVFIIPPYKKDFKAEPALKFPGRPRPKNYSSGGRKKYLDRDGFTQGRTVAQRRDACLGLAGFRLWPTQ